MQPCLNGEMALKSAIKSIISFLGPGLHRIKEKDAFHDQKMLVDGMETPVVFDVGAYIDEITAEYKRLFPRSIIYSFEPFSDSFRELQEKSEAGDLVKAFQLAIADRPGAMRLCINADTSCNSLLPPLKSARKNYDGKAESVPIVELEVTMTDDFCKIQSVPRIHILKLHAEGAELMVLRGASESLAQKSIDLIYTEIMFVPHYEGGAMFHELCSFLSDFGYTLFGVYDLKRAGNGQLRWGNAIFVSPYVRANVINAR